MFLCCDCSTFSFVNGIIRTQNLPLGMVFIGSCNQIFMSQYLFLQLVFNKSEHFVRVPDTCGISNDYTNIIKVYENYIEFNTE